MQNLNNQLGPCMCCVCVERTSPLWRHVSLSSEPVPGSGSAAAACPWPHDAASSAAPGPALPPAGPSSYCTACKQEEQMQVHQHTRLYTYCIIYGDVASYFSSNILRSCSLLSRQLCLSFSSPNREVAWALSASQSLASCKVNGITVDIHLARLEDFDHVSKK